MISPGQLSDSYCPSYAYVDSFPTLTSDLKMARHSSNGLAALCDVIEFVGGTSLIGSVCMPQSTSLIDVSSSESLLSPIWNLNAVLSTLSPPSWAVTSAVELSPLAKINKHNVGVSYTLKPSLHQIYRVLLTGITAAALGRFRSWCLGLCIAIKYNILDGESTG